MFLSSTVILLHMEYELVPSISYYRGGRFPEADAKRIIVEILSATAFFHLQGVVHRDLKPEVHILCLYH